MSENEIKRNEVKGRTRSGGDVSRELDFDRDIAVPAPSLDPIASGPSTPNGLRESKESIEIGGDNACDCTVPELEVDKGEVGPWLFQVVYCSECLYHFGSALEHADAEDEEDEDDE